MEAPIEEISSCTVEEYFRLEQEASQKHEYRNGQVVAMAGGSPNHSLIIANTIRAVGNRLRHGTCRVYDSNLRVRLAPSVRYSYPDVTVICGPAAFDPLDKSRTTVINPRLIIEVTSEATEYYDRIGKFRHYLQLESLHEYVLISQKRPAIDAYFRQREGTWLFSNVQGIGAAARLRSIEIELPLAEVYAGAEFPPEPLDDEPTLL